MSKINFKIHSFNEENYTLLVSFSDDKSKKPVQDYKPISIQIADLTSETESDLFKNLAKIGTTFVEIQNKNESIQDNKEYINLVKSIVGKTETIDTTTDQ